MIKQAENIVRHFTDPDEDTVTGEIVISAKETGRYRKNVICLCHDGHRIILSEKQMEDILRWARG